MVGGEAIATNTPGYLKTTRWKLSIGENGAFIFKINKSLYREDEDLGANKLILYKNQWRLYEDDSELASGEVPPKK